MGRISIPGFGVVATLALAAVAGGCGGDSRERTAGTSDTTSPTQDAPAAARAPAGDGAPSAGKTALAATRSRPGKKLTVVDSDYGRVIADARGEALYLFGKEERKRSECYGACARAWPPALTSSRPRAGAGVAAGLLGTTKRRNGKLQATYRGHPLYYYVDDSPGTILCQDVAEFGGLWLVVKPNGDPVA